ncbi:class F sortase [Arthrobacter sp. NPDC058288]|uniref:class F sortase n=1 Tax=Arthrobacter sp. NPDC058288 TaxID=3346424 RepID=UPI0036EF83F4
MTPGTTTAAEPRRRPSFRLKAAAVTAAALLLTACAPSAPVPQSSPAKTGESALPAAASPPPAAAPEATQNPAQKRNPAQNQDSIQQRPATLPAVAAAVPVPISLSVAGTSINMTVVPVGVSPDRAMEIPEAFDRAGWYRFGPAPGAAAGTAVIAGHVDTTSEQAPFSQLKTLQAGTAVLVGRQGAPALNYRVVSVELMAKDSFDGATLFRRSGPHELKVVTCGGRWLQERMDYSDNVIVTAVLE